MKILSRLKRLVRRALGIKPTPRRFPRKPCPLCGRSMAYTQSGDVWKRHRCQRLLPFNQTLTDVSLSYLRNPTAVDNSESQS